MLSSVSQSNTKHFDLISIQVSAAVAMCTSPCSYSGQSSLLLALKLLLAIPCLSIDAAILLDGFVCVLLRSDTTKIIITLQFCRGTYWRTAMYILHHACFDFSQSARPMTNSLYAHDICGKNRVKTVWDYAGHCMFCYRTVRYTPKLTPLFSFLSNHWTCDTSPSFEKALMPSPNFTTCKVDESATNPCLSCNKDPILLAVYTVHLGESKKYTHFHTTISRESF